MFRPTPMAGACIAPLGEEPHQSLRGGASRERSMADVRTDAEPDPVGEGKAADWRRG
jgi:hypothetical protein